MPVALDIPPAAAPACGLGERRRFAGTAPRSRTRLRALEDEQLAALIAAGDREAFAVMYDRHLPALIRYCRGILLVSEDAEDAAQSAMLAALRSLTERPAPLKLRAWLFRVAHNEAISLLRRRRPHDSLDDALGVSTPDAAEAAATRARLQQLITDLRGLPDRQRGALVMRELCGLEYSEIAGAFGCSQSTAMQTVYEARSALAQCEEGRTLTCTGVQRLISDGDGRSLRARRVRAHMRACNNCRTFEGSVTHRRRDFGLLVPVAGKFGGLGVLLGALRSVGAARVAGITARIQSVPGGLRGAAVGVAVVAAGGGVAQLDHHARHARHPSSPVDASVVRHVALLPHGTGPDVARVRREPARHGVRPPAAIHRPARAYARPQPAAAAVRTSAQHGTQPAVAGNPAVPAPPAPVAKKASLPLALSVSTGTGGTVHAGAAVDLPGVAASASASVSVSRGAPAAAASGSVDVVGARADVSACLLNCR